MYWDSLSLIITNLKETSRATIPSHNSRRDQDSTRVKGTGRKDSDIITPIAGRHCTDLATHASQLAGSLEDCCKFLDKRAQLLVHKSSRKLRKQINSLVLHTC